MKINIAGFLAHHAVETNALVSILGVVVENLAVSPIQKALLNEGLSILANGAANLSQHAAVIAALPVDAPAIEVVATPVQVPVPAPLAAVGEPVAVAVAEPASASAVAEAPAPAQPDPTPVDPASVAATTAQTTHPNGGDNEGFEPAPAPAMDGTLASPAEIAAAEPVAVEAVGTVDGEPVAVVTEPAPEVVGDDDPKWVEMGYRFDPLTGEPLKGL